MGDYEFRWVRGEHIEVFLNGVFQFSADSIQEALQELGDSIDQIYGQIYGWMGTNTLFLEAVRHA